MFKHVSTVFTPDRNTLVSHFVDWESAPGYSLKENEPLPLRSHPIPPEQKAETLNFNR